MARSRKIPVDQGNRNFLSKTSSRIHNSSIRPKKKSSSIADKIGQSTSSSKIGGGISKSSLRRQKRHAKQNLSGGSLSRLLEALPSSNEIDLDDNINATTSRRRRKDHLIKVNATSNSQEGRLLNLARRAYLKRDINGKISMEIDNNNINDNTAATRPIIGRSKPLSSKTHQQIVKGESERFDKVLNYTASLRDDNNNNNDINTTFASLRTFISSSIGCGQLGVNSEN